MHRFAVDVKATVGAHGPNMSGKKVINRLRDPEFESFPLNVCQCHKSRSMSSEVTVGATFPLGLLNCQI